MDEAERCHALAILDKGSLVAEGSPEKLQIEPKVQGGKYFHHHSLLYNKHELTWVGASGVSGMNEIAVPLSKGEYTIRMVFSEPDVSAKPGDRVFDISINDSNFLTDFDIVREAKTARSTIIREMKKVSVDDRLTLKFSARQGSPSRCPA